MVIEALLLGALSGSEIGILVTAIGGLITGIGGLWVGYRGQNKTEKGGQLALLLEGYDEIVANLQGELGRLMGDLEAARNDLGRCKALCTECEAGMAKLSRTIEELERQLHIKGGGK